MCNRTLVRCSKGIQLRIHTESTLKSVPYLKTDRKVNRAWLVRIQVTSDNKSSQGY